MQHQPQRHVNPSTNELPERRTQREPWNEIRALDEVVVEGTKFRIRAGLLAGTLVGTMAGLVGLAKYGAPDVAYYIAGFFALAFAWLVRSHHHGKESGKNPPQS